MGDTLRDISGFENTCAIKGDPILVDGAPFDYSIHTVGTKSIALRFNRPTSPKVNEEDIAVFDASGLRIAGIKNGFSTFTRFRTFSLAQEGGQNRTLFEKIEDGTPNTAYMLQIATNGRLVLHIKEGGTLTSKETASSTIALNTVYDVWTSYDKGYAVNFDGANDIINLGMKTDLWSKSKTSFSLSFSVKTDTLPVSGFPTIITSDEFAVNNGSILVYRNASNGAIGFDYWDGAERIAESDDYPKTDFTNRYTITCVYDSTLASDNVKIFVNGNIGSVTDDTTDSSDSADNLWIGGDGGAAGTGLDGNIRDFRWWNRALTDEEVLGVYNGTSAPTPQYWLPLNENTGNPIDIINGYTTTLTNGAAWITPTPSYHIYVNGVDKTLSTSADAANWQSDLTDRSLWIFKRGANSNGHIYGDLYDFKFFKEKAITTSHALNTFTNKWTIADIADGHVAITNYYATYISDEAPGLGYDHTGFDSTGFT